MELRIRGMVIVAVVAAAGLLAGCEQSTTDAFIVEPYLQNPGQEDMHLMWVVPDVDGMKVRFGQGEKLDGVPKHYHVERARIEDSTRDNELPDQIPQQYVCQAWLSDLQPGATYRYRVSAGDDTFEGEFTTIPAKPEKFTFVAYGDTRTQHDRHREVAQAIGRDKPDLVIHTGDVVKNGGFLQYKDHFFDPARGVFSHIPVMVARGNHEGNGIALWQLFEPLEWDRRWYSFDWGNVHFVALDSMAGRGNFPEMVEWLKADLAASKADWKVVYYHHPTYDIGSHYTRWGRESLAPVLRAGGVDVVFAGHTHTYQRFHPMFTAGENEKRPITYLVAAGGGAPLYSVEDNPHAAITTSRYHFVRCTVDGRKLVGEAVTPDGEVFDRFVIEKNPDGTRTEASLAEAMDEADFETIREQLGPWLNLAAMLPARPDSKTPVTHTFRLPAVEGKALKYTLDLADRSDAKWALVGGPVSGTIPAGGSAEVTFTVQADNTRVEYYGDTTRLLPWLRFELSYEIDGKTGRIRSIPARVSTDEERQERIDALKARDDLVVPY